MRSNLIRTASLLMTLTILSACAGPSRRPETPQLTASTGEERPYVRDSLAPPTTASVAFDEARQAYRNGDWKKAAQRFAAYRTGVAPDDPLADNALFGEGLALFEQGRFDEAANRFGSILSLWPEGETAVAARINLGVCRYWSGDYDEARRLLQEAAHLTIRPADLAYIAYYRAALAERRGIYLEAALKAVDGERLAEDRALVVLAREKVERLFHTFLSDKELEGFTHSFAGKWPAKLAWEELLVRYRRTGQEEKRQEAIRALAMSYGPDDSSSAKLLANEDAYIQQPKIGVILPITGPWAEAGRRMFHGWQLAANDYHELIRNLGVEMVMKDSGVTPEEARMAALDLAATSSTIAILGPVATETLQEVATTVHQYGVATITSTVRTEGLTSASSRLFSTVYLASAEAKNLAELAVTTMGLRRFVVLYEEGERGRQMTAYFREGVAKRGGTLVGAEPFAPDETDFSAQIKAVGGMSDEVMRKEILDIASADKTMRVERINEILARRYAGKLSAPYIDSYEGLPLTKRNFRPAVRLKFDGVVVIGNGRKTGLLMGQLVFYNVRDLPRFVSNEANGKAFLTNAERFADGVYMVDGFFAESTRPAVKDFVRHYRIAFREEPDRVAAQSYDATRLLMAAMARGVRTRRQMTFYLSELNDFPGVTGNLTTTPSGDMLRSPFYLTVKGGKIVEFDPRLLPQPPMKERR